MYYYEVLVGDLRYHGKSALTYSSEAELLPGSVARIALRNRSVLGIVQRSVPEPSFAAKPISAVALSPPLPVQFLALIDWLYGYYPAPFGSIVRQFLPPSTAFPRPTHPKPDARNTKPDSPDAPPLTPEQSQALAQVQPTGYHLLHGITGSGKTRLYVELTKKTLESGKSAILLTPEIGLTAQLVETFERAFAGRVHVLHSRLTNAARRNRWYDILVSTDPIVVIGPRSALFAPVRHLGLIVLDESHDQAYKNETSPRYRTERVAAKLAALHDACLVSGSATPNVEEYYLAGAKKRPIIPLTNLAVKNNTQSSIDIVDLRDRSQLSRSPVLSTPLIESMQRALSSSEQSMLFLNRRGTAGAVLCSSCGWRALCAHCDLSFTYHGDAHIMRCHVCGRSAALPSSCPECGETDIVLKSIGTKAVVDEVQRLFPQARLARFDTDTAREEQLETQLQPLQSGAVDIIIGTQMITKGLDLPKLSVVGVLNADASLLIPDYTAAERTFQLLTQVIGRAHRGHRTSRVVIQSYSPENPTISAATKRDWAAFYESEIAERRAFHFPPFVYMLRLTCTRASTKAAEQAATKLSEQMRKQHTKLILEGPSPAFHPRESGKYKWQLIVKSPSRGPLVDIATTLPAGWTADLDPVNLL